MKKIISLVCLTLIICALQTENHQQAKPLQNTPAVNIQPPNQNNPTQPGPVVVNRPDKQPGYESTPGGPFGRHPESRRTCFQSPCYDPVGPCTVDVLHKPRRSAKTSTTSQSSSQSTGKQGKWHPVVFVVRVQEKLARFAGFRCEAN